MNKLTLMEKEALIHRIINGFTYFRLDGVLLKIYSPSSKVLHRANFFKKELIEDIKYGWWMTDKQVDLALFKLTKGKFPLDYKDRIKKARKEIDNGKVELFKMKFNEKKDKAIRRTITALQDKIHNYNSQVHTFKSFTLNGYADICMSDYIIFNSVVDENEEKYLYNNDCFGKFSKIIKFINDNEIDTETFRELARTEPWRSYWSCNKSPFGSIDDLTEHQRYLCIFSRMYDNVYESYECPAEKVIEDDWKLDGWFIEQRRKIQRGRKKSEVNKKLNKYKDSKADEVYLFPETDEDMAEINSLNDLEGRRIIRDRHNLIKKKGLVKEYELPDRQRQIMMQANENFRKQVKGNK